MVITAHKNAAGNELVRSNKQSDKPEINGLRGSNFGSLKCRVKKYCVDKTPSKIFSTCEDSTSKSSQNFPYKKSEDSTAI
jgi:hypothetical protein